MSIRTYYHVLGVPRDATQEEITSAKNALAKIYHPDANIKSTVDTTAHMQEILEAYRVLSNPEKRKQYDMKLSGGAPRVFRTFTLRPEEDSTEETSFAACWNVANKLNDVVEKSARLIERESRRDGMPRRILKKLTQNHYGRPAPDLQLARLSRQALQYITLLKDAKIPIGYWHPEAMNWMLVFWGQNQEIDFHTLFVQYDRYVNQTLSGPERLKLHAQGRLFHTNLKKLLAYTL